jgi:8-oxo-dGTP pyrophosphatase MutT (NUDIX family)
MTASSILPVSYHKGQLYFLFGKENPKEDSARGFSDFGGGVEDGESIYNTALREGGEELTGFLGDSSILRKYIKSKRGPYRLQYNDYHVHIIPIDYDTKLPIYYNQNHRFLWDRMDRNLLNRTKLFEKIEIQWFTPHQMKKRLKEFRSFYQEIVEHILQEKSQIKKYICKRLSTAKSRKKNSKRKSFRRITLRRYKKKI